MNKKYVGKTECEVVYLVGGKYIIENREDVCILEDIDEEIVVKSSIALLAAKDAIKAGLRQDVAEVVYQ